MFIYFKKKNRSSAKSLVACAGNARAIGINAHLQEQAIKQR